MGYLATMETPEFGVFLAALLVFKMAAFRRGVLFSPPWWGLTVVRHRSKPNIQKPRIPHPLRLTVMETTAKPVFEPKPALNGDQCEYVEERHRFVEKDPSIYERLLGQELIQLLDSHPLVVIYHTNSITGRSLFSLKKMLLRNRMYLKTYNRFIVRTALQDTKYEVLLPLFQSHTKFVFSQDLRVDLVLKMQSKMPEYVLLGAVVGDRVFSKRQLEWYGSLPSLDIARAWLCYTLTALTMFTVQHLTHHQRQLGYSLKLLSQGDCSQISSSSS